MEAQNPFAALTLIVAPAVLTNASCVLSLATGNRLARAVDRAREITLVLEQNPGDDSHLMRSRARELRAAQKRMLLLIRALRSFYIGIGSFATAALVSLIGAVITVRIGQLSETAFEVIAILIGVVAVGSLVRGSLLLARETGIAVNVMQERAAQVQDEFASLIDDAENQR